MIVRQDPFLQGAIDFPGHDAFHHRLYEMGYTPAPPTTAVQRFRRTDHRRGVFTPFSASAAQAGKRDDQRIQHDLGDTPIVAGIIPPF